jgi:outer membrane receptor protein involved in Fe transport
MTQQIWTKIKTLPLVCAVGAVGLAGQQAYAQEATTPQASRGPLEEVVVTANRREEKINDIGMAIQAFSGDALDQFAVSNVADLQNIVPSFNVTQGYQGVPVYTLRGVGFNAINFSATSTVGTYVDEAAYAYPIMNTGPIFDVERVEVLKGPQGTLYGRNTTGGLIDVITNKPTKDFQSGVSADIGNFDTYNVEGFVSGPLFGDRVQGRLAVRGERTDRGYQESLSTGERLGEKEKYGVRASLAVQATDSTNIDFSANYFENKSDSLAGQAVAFVPTADPAIAAAAGPTLARFAGNNDPRLCNLGPMGQCLSFGGRKPDDARQAEFVPRSVREQARGSSPGFSGRLQEDNPFIGLKLRVAQDITDGIRLVSLTNYNYFERDALVDAGGSTSEVFVNRVTGKINSFSEDLHFEGETEGGINWLAGAYYANDRIIDVTRSNVFNNTPVNAVRGLAQGIQATDAGPLGALGLGVFPPNTFNTPNGRGPFSADEVTNAFREFQDGGTLRTETYSFFANGDAPLTDSLKLTLGARVTNDVQDFAGCSRDSFGNIIPTVTLANRFLNATSGSPDPNSPDFNPALGMPLATPPAQGQCVTFDNRTNTFGIVTSRLNEDNISWRTGLDWKATSDVLLYTTVSRGYKSGTTPLNASNSAQQNAPVTQEKLTAFEIGTKASLLDRRIQANVAGFFYDYKDKQINTFFRDPIFAVLARLDNVPESEIYGIDADVTLRATDSLSFNVNVLGLHSEVTKYLGTDQFGRDNLDFSGSEIPNTPKWLVSGTTFYNSELATWNLSAALNARYQKRSSTILDAPSVPGFRESNFVIPGFAVVNGSVGVTSPDGTLSFTVFARNLLDKYYFQSIITNATTIVRYAGEPRTFGLTAAKKF